MSPSRIVRHAPDPLQVEPTSSAHAGRGGEGERVHLAPGRARTAGRSRICGSNLHLPESLSSFIGRRRDISAVTDMVGRSRLVTICGPGGIGKTRLALEVARGRMQHDPDGGWLVELAPTTTPDGAWMVELAAVSDPDLVPQAVLAELLGPAAADPRAMNDLVEHLRGRRALVVLDNCEHVIDSCVALSSHLLRSCPGLRILATSRQPLGITGERVWWLPPMTVPGPETDPGLLDGNEAVGLFVERAGDANPGFALTAGVAPVIAELCRRLDGLPLAIELAAARTAVLPPGEILSRLDDRFHLLTGGDASAAPRHRSLRAAIEWSSDLLSPQEAAMLRRLSVFNGSWSLDAAEAVCCGAPVERRHVLDLHSALRAKSLIVADVGASRFRMLESIRDHARGKLDEAGETERLLAHHAGWCLERAEAGEAARQDDDRDRWLQLLDDDHDNFRAALVWARDRNEGEAGLRLANALTWFWETRGHLREGLEWLRWALSAASDSASAGRAQAMRNVGRLVHVLGDHTSALDLIDRSVELYRELGDAHEAAGCVCHDVVEMCRNPLHAIPLLERAVSAIRRTDDPDRLAHALSNLGQALMFRGDAVGARACFREVLGLRSANINDDVVDDALFGLARVALLVGDYSTVEAPLLEVLSHAEQAGDPDARSAALSLLGELARARGDTERARRMLGDALELARAAGAVLSIGRCELFLGGVDYAEGALDSARTYFTQALGRSEAGATLAYHQVRCTLGLADVAAAGGDAEVAARFYVQASACAEANGDAQGVARSLVGQADLALAAGDIDAASRLHHEAMALEERMGDLAGLARSLESLAALATREANHEKAARLFAAASAQRDYSGFARPLPLQVSFECSVARSREELGVKRWVEVWDEGRRLSVEEAISYARKNRRRRQRPSMGWDSLTPAEHEVVTLVVDGLTNAEVAGRLFISPRTVGHHLAHVYAKLEIHSRRDLMREARARSGGGGRPTSTRPSPIGRTSSAC